MTTRIQAILTVFLLAVLGASGAAIAQQFEIFEKGDELPAIRWQKIIAENLLREKLVASLSPITKDQRFNVYVTIRLKSIKGRQRVERLPEDMSADDIVDLGKLGTAAPAINDDMLAKGSLWGQVEYIRTDIVLYDYAPAEQVNIMQNIAKRIVHSVVPPWRSGVNMVVPKYEVFSWFYDRKVMTGAILAALLFILFSGFLALNFFYNWYQRREDQRVSFVNISPGSFDTTVAAPRAPAAQAVNAQWRVADSKPAPQLVASHHDEEAAADLSFDPAEWKLVIEADPELGAVLANIAPSEMTARVFSSLPVELVKKTTEAALRMSEKDIQNKTAQLHQLMTAMARKKSGASFLNHAVDLVGRVGPLREGVIFESLVQAKRPDLVEQAARRHFPSHLIMQLPADLLRMFVNLLRTEERIELALAVSANDREQVLEAIGPKGAKLREYAEIQLQKFEADEGRANEVRGRSYYVWWDFVKLVRRTLASDGELARKTDLYLNPWIDEQRARCKKAGGRDGKAA